jgi:hypothetical protein
MNPSIVTPDPGPIIKHLILKPAEETFTSCIIGRTPFWRKMACKKQTPRICSMRQLCCDTQLLRETLEIFKERILLSFFLINVI